MARIARLVVQGEPAVYHVISRTALPGFVLGDAEKDFLLGWIKKLSSVYFVELLGFCVMGTHFHLLIRLHVGDKYSEEEIRRRFLLYYGEDSGRELLAGQIPTLRAKWESLSEYVKEIKQGFSRYFNRRHKRRGYFWADRFKSLIVEDGETLINCLAYIDLNPVRAGLVKRPEEYRWCSLGYHLQTNNKDRLLSLDFGLREFGVKSAKSRLSYYRRFVHEKGGLLPESTGRELPVAAGDRFRLRTRYFIDSGIIGSREFVSGLYERFKGHLDSRREKKPRQVRGLSGVYSLKRLSE